MNTRKLAAVTAALLLGLQFGSPTVAQVSEQDLQIVQAYIASGQVEELTAYLAMHPDLLALSGAFGAALRSFAAAPSLASLQTVASLPSQGVSVAAAAPARAFGGASIY